MKKNKVKNTPPQLFFDNRIMRVEQVAETLGYSRDQIYKLVQKKKIPYRKRGNTLFFMSQEIFDWVNQGVA